jgi:hypothetical protein
MKKAFYEDLTAIMSDVFVRTSAGNTGPDAASLANYVPWVLCRREHYRPPRHLTCQARQGHGVHAHGPDDGAVQGRQGPDARLQGR